MKKRIIICLLLISLLVSCFGIFAYAEDTEAATHDSEEYMSSLNEYITLSDGTTCSPVFEDYYDLEYILSLSESERFLMSGEIVCVQEYYAPSYRGFLLVHYFNPDFRICLGGEGDPENPERASTIGKCTINGDDSAILLDFNDCFTSKIFDTFYIYEDIFGDFTYKVVGDAAHRKYDITDLTLGYFSQWDDYGFCDGFETEYKFSDLHLNYYGLSFDKTCSNYISTGSSIEKDLSSDLGFNFDDYPEAKDYSLKLIQLAESEQGELVVYVYTPFYTSYRRLYATHIRLSTHSPGETPNFADYDLRCVRVDKTISKYIVEGFSLSDAETRYYSVACLYREYNERFDGENNNSETHKAFEVNELWSVSGSDENTIYEKKELKTLNITNKEIGYLIYLKGADGLSAKGQQVHYIAFNTDIPLEDLLAVKLTYIGKVYEGVPSSENHRNQISAFYHDGKWVYADQVGSSTSFDFLWLTMGVDSQWSCIETKDEFLNGLEDADMVITSEARDALNSSAWVVRYYENEVLAVADIFMPGYVKYQWTEMSEFSLIQLNYQMNGDTYSVGCIDNRATEEMSPIIIYPDYKEQADVNKDHPVGQVLSFLDQIKASFDKFLSDASDAFDIFKQVIGLSFVAFAGVFVFIIGFKVISFIGSIFKRKR